jgi:hypothetical protein
MFSLCIRYKPVHVCMVVHAGTQKRIILNMTPTYMIERM